MRPALSRCLTYATCAGVLLASSAPSGNLFGQTARGAIAGHVVDVSTGRPVAGAQVDVLTASGGFVRRTTTNERGAYAADDLPPGVYVVRVQRAGYLDGALGGARHEGMGRPVELGTAERLGGVDVSLCAPASLSGSVRDENGDGLAGVTVRVMRRDADSERYEVVAEDATDDLGQYRIWGLPPGVYLPMIQSALVTFPSDLRGTVSAHSRPAAGDRLVESGNALPVRVTASDDTVRLVYPTTWFGNGHRPSDGLRVEVGCGHDRLGVDFALAPVPAYTVSGIVKGPVRPGTLLPLRLLPGGDHLASTVGFETAVTATDPEGRFVFEGVPSGTYLVRVLHQQLQAAPTERIEQLLQRELAAVFLLDPAAHQRRVLTSRFVFPPPEPTLFGEQPVTVGDQDVSDVEIRISPAPRVAGSIVFTGNRRPPEFAEVRVAVALDQEDGRVMDALVPGWVTDAGVFSTYGAPPSRYRVRILGEVPGWFVQSAMLDGRDRIDHPFDLDAEDRQGMVVTFTDRPSSLQGTVRTEGRPDPAATVLLFPADRSLWNAPGPSARRFVMARTTNRGTYVVPHLPPGEYFVVAVPDADANDWRAQARLSALALRATRQPIGDGSAAHRDLETGARERERSQNAISRPRR